MIDPKRDAARLKQLPLDLQIEEAEDERSFIAPEEAQRISELARMALEQMGREPGSSPGWMEDYRHLRAVGWPWRVACYIAWAASPKKERNPKTQEELATRMLGLTSDRQIGTWRKKNPVIDETVAILQAAPLLAHRRDIYDALVASAMNPDYKGHQDRKLALQLLGDYVDKRELRLNGTMTNRDVTARSDEELRALLGDDDSADSSDDDEA